MLGTLRKKLANVLSPRLARGLNRLGLVRLERGEYQEAIDCFERALQLLEATEAAPPDGLSAILNNLGETYRVLNRFPEAENAFERALSLRRSVNTSRLELAEILNNLGLVRFERGQFNSA